MEVAEFEQRLHDAEVRLARLKALYEQWFQGIERIEPQIARKELDRVIEQLRREQPRNTALRFRYQQLVARYGTYGIYWGRVAKQIEEGTYRRDVQRARARAERERSKERTDQVFEIDVDLDSLESGLGDFGEDDLDAILGALAPVESRPPAVGRPAAETFGGGRDVPSRGDELGRDETRTDPAPPPVESKPPPSFPSTPQRSGLRPPTAPVPASLARPNVPHPLGPDAASARGVPRNTPGSSVPIGRMLRPATPAQGAIREEVGAHSRSNRPIAARSPGAGPTNAPRPLPPPPRTSPEPAAAPQSGLDMRALFERYVEARRRNNERTDNVRFESLQQSVEKMMPKLREKHGNKPIDFDVVVQNGKVGLKPRVRG